MNEPKIHELKIKYRHFDHVSNGNKPFEIRYNDRDFKLGDVLWLRETQHCSNPGYTGQSQSVRVTYITSYEQKDGYVVMGIALI